MPAPAHPPCSFGTVVDNEALPDLDKQLECLAPRIPDMRKAMRGIWQRMLYSTVYGGYLGEASTADGFDGIMQVGGGGGGAHAGINPCFALAALLHYPGLRLGPMRERSQVTAQAGMPCSAYTRAGLQRAAKVPGAAGPRSRPGY